MQLPPPNGMHRYPTSRAATIPPVYGNVWGRRKVGKAPPADRRPCKARAGLENTPRDGMLRGGKQAQVTPAPMGQRLDRKSARTDSPRVGPRPVPTSFRERVPGARSSRRRSHADNGHERGPNPPQNELRRRTPGNRRPRARSWNLRSVTGMPPAFVRSTRRTPTLRSTGR